MDGSGAYGPVESGSGVFNASAGNISAGSVPDSFPDLLSSLAYFDIADLLTTFTPILLVSFAHGVSGLSSPPYLMYSLSLGGTDDGVGKAGMCESGIGPTG